MATTTMPLIAIAPASRNDDYLESARQAGAETWLLDRGKDAPSDVVRRVAGLMLLGGADVEPSRYGETPHPTFQASETDRDGFHMAHTQAGSAMRGRRATRLRISFLAVRRVLLNMLPNDRQPPFLH